VLAASGALVTEGTENRKVAPNLYSVVKNLIAKVHFKL
jgi:hypothetical protein